MVNIPKERKTYCKSKKCGKHSVHKVSSTLIAHYLAIEIGTAAATLALPPPLAPAPLLPTGAPSRRRNGLQAAGIGLARAA